mmetsp:Transcript_16911/g.48103  ORF Transcript_16911/g.48103 Transcript_16911/m.48103 type:complete len:212 (-) Transcript_16911:12-647(-)
MRSKRRSGCTSRRRCGGTPRSGCGACGGRPGPVRPGHGSSRASRRRRRRAHVVETTSARRPSARTWQSARRRSARHVGGALGPGIGAPQGPSWCVPRGTRLQRPGCLQADDDEDKVSDPHRGQGRQSGGHPRAPRGGCGPDPEGLGRADGAAGRAAKGQKGFARRRAARAGRDLIFSGLVYFILFFRAPGIHWVSTEVFFKGGLSRLWGAS